MADTATETEPTGGRMGRLRRSPRLLAAAGAAAVLLAGAGFVLTRGDEAQAGTGAEAKAGAEGGKAEKKELGAVLKLEPTTVNLADGHFLQLGMALQLPKDLGKEEKVDGSRALDLAITLLSNRQMNELSSNERRQEVKKRLVKQVSDAYSGKVTDVYFTEFVMQ